MRNQIKGSFLGLALLLLPVGATASADLERLKVLFSQSFYTDVYERGRCGQNIMRFARLAREEGILVHSGEILRIENRGGFMMDMVSGLVARESGPRLSGAEARALPRGMERAPGEKRWYFHVVLAFEGHIFDFDFTNEPQAPRVSDYFERMFIQRSAPPDFGIAYAPHQWAELVRNGYQLQVTRVGEYFDYLDHPQRPQGSPTPVVRLRDYRN